MRSLAISGRAVVYGLAFAAIAGAAVAVYARGSEADEPTDARAGGGWERLPDPPLAPRSNVIAVWTGNEALFAGGDTFTCPPGASCAGENVTVFSDGAAFDPEKRTWRAISDAPLPLARASTAVVDDDVYFLVQGSRSGAPAFLRYSIEGDSWESLPMPSAASPAWFRLGATGDAVVAYATSNEQGATGDFIFTPGSGAWRELPESPLGPAFDREMTWLDPHLYLFDRELADNPGSERPSLTRAARFDPAAGTWERLPDSEILASGPWLAHGAQLVNPSSGGADGGAVNNWGRTYPNGGVLDTDKPTWVELPGAPTNGHSAGAVGLHGLLFLATSGWVLDLAEETWFELAGIPGDGEITRRNLLSAGPDAITFGGERWTHANARGELLGDAWIWRSGAGR